MISPRGCASIVTGPPAAGKTTLVRESFTVGDLILDHDLIYAAISGLEVHDHRGDLLPLVLAAQNSILKRLASHVVRHIWMVACAPEHATRRRLARLLPAAVTYVIDTPADICAERLEADGRDPQLAHDWWSRYEPNADRHHRHRRLAVLELLRGDAVTHTSAAVTPRGGGGRGRDGNRDSVSRDLHRVVLGLRDSGSTKILHYGEREISRNPLGSFLAASERENGPKLPHLVFAFRRAVA